jgi:hypothetical protein
MVFIVRHQHVQLLDNKWIMNKAHSINLNVKVNLIAENISPRDLLPPDSSTDLIFSFLVHEFIFNFNQKRVTLLKFQRWQYFFLTDIITRNLDKSSSFNVAMKNVIFSLTLKHDDSFSLD